MSLRAFLTDLTETGQVKVPAVGAPLDEEVRACADLFELQAKRAAMEDPGGMPDIQLRVAGWAAVMLYRACQYFVSRETPAETVQAALNDPPPPPEASPCELPDTVKGRDALEISAPRSYPVAPARKLPGAGASMLPGVCYSVDLYMRYLPDLVGLARGVAASDPLVVGLPQLARQWPLSSVEAAGVGNVDVSGFIRHPLGGEVVLLSRREGRVYRVEKERIMQLLQFDSPVEMALAVVRGPTAHEFAVVGEDRAVYLMKIEGLH